MHSFVNEITRPVGTYLYGRRMYETMVYWEAAHTIPDQEPFVLEWARVWQAADKVVYSTTLDDGPQLAAHAMRAGLVDECHQLIAPVVVGGGTRFFPDGVRVNLELMDERRFDNGVVYLRYATRES